MYNGNTIYISEVTFSTLWFPAPKHDVWFSKICSLYIFFLRLGRGKRAYTRVIFYKKENAFLVTRQDKDVLCYREDEPWQMHIKSKVEI